MVTAQKKLRLAMIGCGFFAQNHLNAWSEIPEVEIVAVCDRDPARADAACTRFGIARAYTDAAALFDAEKLDFVDIATTMETHRPLVTLAAAHGVHVIVQKPLAPSLEDCRAIVETCRAAGLRLMVHENFRFQSPILAARAALAEGRIGTPHFAQLSFRSGYDVFSGQPYLATEKRFILIDLGIHILDVCRAIMGEAETLYCAAQKVNSADRRRGCGDHPHPTQEWRRQHCGLQLFEPPLARALSPDSAADRGRPWHD